jgi:pyruvate dehydrogenase E2 component (dihydrolipoamide acetyltransferase)
MVSISYEIKANEKESDKMADVVIMPRLSLNEETNLLSQWYVAEGDKVSVGDKLFCIETDKSTLDVDSEFEGTVLKKYYDDYAVVTVLTPVCVIGQEGDEIPELEVPAEEAAEDAAAPAAEASVQAEAATEAAASVAAPDSLKEKKGISPRAKKLAEQNGINNFTAIPASGAENRILEEDIINYMKNGAPVLRQPTGEKKTVKLPRIRKVIAKNMMNSLQSTAQLTMSSVFNASAIQACRARFKAEEGEMKNVTIGDLVLFATARTLEEFPYMNSWMVNDDEAIEFADVNLGCAVDTERGLMVPTIMGANVKSLLEVSNDLKEMTGECRKGSISPDKLKEATFTVTNLGSFGIRTFTPILNPPQVGILGVGTIDYMMKQTREGVLYYPGCTLSLTVDHRLVDGGPAARFLKKLCENLEHIEELIAE